MGFGRKREARRPSRPAIEALEGRAVPATFHAADVAQLQADIAAVSNSNGPNTIILAARTYNLPGELKIQNAGNLTIQGNPDKPGATLLVGGFSNRVFEIDGGTVTLSGVTVSGGNTVAQGGGIYAQDAHLTIEKSAINGNSATQMGGGIFMQGGTLDVENSSVVGNVAEGGAHAYGGGIAASNAQVTVSGSTFNDNTVFGADVVGQQLAAGNTGDGGGIYAQGGTLSISDSTITKNQVLAATSGTNAASSGGAVSTTETIVNVARSTISGNSLSAIGSRTAAYQGSAFSTVGGSLTITASTVGANAPSGRYQFYYPGATVVLKGSTVAKQKFPGTYTLGNNRPTPVR